MAEEFQIYLRDSLINSLNTLARRKIPEIHAILTEIAPEIVIKRINPTNQGFIITYNNDLDINFIFDTVKIGKLSDNSLVAVLASDTQVNRQCVITGLTNDIFSKNKC